MEQTRIFDVVGIGLGLGPALLFFMAEDWNDIEGYTWSAVWLTVVFIGYAGHSTWRMRYIEVEYNLLAPTKPPLLKNFLARN